MPDHILSATATLIAQSRRPNWGPLLLAQVLGDEIHKTKSIPRLGLIDQSFVSSKYDLQIDSPSQLGNLSEWTSSRLSELLEIATSFSEQLPTEGSSNIDLILGLNGMIADETRIVDLGIGMGQSYKRILIYIECIKASSLSYTHEIEKYFKAEMEAYWNSSRNFFLVEGSNLASFCETVGPTITRRIEEEQSATDRNISKKLILKLSYKFSAPAIDSEPLLKKLRLKVARDQMSVLQAHANLAYAQIKPLVTRSRLDELAIEADVLRKEMLNALTHLVFMHGPTLMRKMKQTLYNDDYGNPLYEKFRVEQEYFVKTVMCRDISDSVWSTLFFTQGNISPLQVLESLLSKYSSMVIGPMRVDDELYSTMTGIEYEYLCASLLERAGWQTRVTASSGDQGIDVIATVGAFKLVVQCKFYSSSVGNAAVQEIIAGREFERADFAAVVSNASFTASAKSLASAANVSLLDHSELAQYHTKLGILMDSSGSQTPAPIRSEDQISNYLQLLECRSISDIVQQTLMLKAEREELQTNDESDSMLNNAIAIVLENKKASVTLVHRRLQIGWNRAAGFLEQMEQMGIVGPVNANGQRAILIKNINDIRRPGAIHGNDIPIPDASELRLMVEDNWRSYLKLAEAGSSDAGQQCLASFEQRIEAMASDMSTGAAQTFFDSVEKIQRETFNEYANSVEQLKQRLGLLKQDPPSPPTVSPSVKFTVDAPVRTSVWDSVRAIFHGLR